MGEILKALGLGDTASGILGNVIAGPLSGGSIESLFDPLGLMKMFGGGGQQQQDGSIQPAMMPKPQPFQYNPQLATPLFGPGGLK